MIYTQRRADHREAERRAEDAERERARWQREDNVRSYEHRRSAYAGFLQAWSGYVIDIVAAVNETGPMPENEDWDSLDAAYVQVRVLAPNSLPIKRGTQS